jgi:hypothetical protein
MLRKKIHAVDGLNLQQLEAPYKRYFPESSALAQTIGFEHVLIVGREREDVEYGDSYFRRH